MVKVLGGMIMYRSLMLVMGVIMLCISACQPADKKQSTAIPAIDSLQKDKQIKDSSAAKDVFPGKDTIQQECELIQRQAESLLEEYHRRSTTEAREQDILIELKKLEQQWKQMDCQQVFGYMLPPDSAPTNR